MGQFLQGGVAVSAERLEYYDVGVRVVDDG
jgi:hypothetical protein